MSALPILMYHRIAVDGPIGLAEWRVRPDQFEAQLDHLQRHGFRSVSVDFWSMTAERRAAVTGSRAVALTFDDATTDFATAAWPLLRKYGFGAALFVVVDRVGGRAEWDAGYGDPAKLLDWEEIVRLAGEGVEIGSHATSHRPLTNLDPEALKDEMRRSKEVIEARIARPVTAIAYPFGDWDARVRTAAAEAGYRTGLTIENGVSTASDDQLALPRLKVDGRADLAGFERLLGQPDAAGQASLA